MAKRSLIIGGVPAAGKTTLMRKVLNKIKDLKTFKYGYLRGLHKDDFAVLGIYSNNEVFAGTDRLSMNVQGHYERFVEKKEFSLLFEGDRLFTQKNLLYLVENYDTRIIWLDPDEDILKKRHWDRQDTQSDKWLKSRATKIKNIMDNDTIMKKTERVTEPNSKVLAQDIYNWFFSDITGD